MLPKKCLGTPNSYATILIGPNTSIATPYPSTFPLPSLRKKKDLRPPLSHDSEVSFHLPLVGTNAHSADTQLESLRNGSLRLNLRRPRSFPVPSVHLPFPFRRFEKKKTFARLYLTTAR
jgi:hypothetical protein